MDTIEQAFSRGSLTNQYNYYLTLLGLRNIAWAAAKQDKTSKHAKFLYTLLALAIESKTSVSVIRQALLMSRMNIESVD
jgi:energy-converting hydrogenase Eha subunit H